MVRVEQFTSKTRGLRIAGLAPYSAPASAGTGVVVGATFDGNLELGNDSYGLSNAGTRDVALARLSASGSLAEPVLDPVRHVRTYGDVANETIRGLRIPSGDLSQGVFAAGYFEGGEARFDDLSAALGGAEKKAWLLKSEWKVEPADDVHADWASFLGDAGRTEALDVLPLGDDVWLAGSLGQSSSLAESQVTLSSGVTFTAQGTKRWFLLKLLDAPAP